MVEMTVSYIVNACIPIFALKNTLFNMHEKEESNTISTHECDVRLNTPSRSFFVFFLLAFFNDVIRIFWQFYV